MVGSTRFKYCDEGKLKKRLGVWYKWKYDGASQKRYVEATMPKLVDEILETHRNCTGKEPKGYDTYSRIPRKSYRTTILWT